MKYLSIDVKQQTNIQPVSSFSFVAILYFNDAFFIYQLFRDIFQSYTYISRKLRLVKCTFHILSYIITETDVMTNYSLQNTSPYGLEYKNIPMTILLLYDRFLYVYLIILFVTCVFSDQFAKGVCQVHILLMSCYFNHVGNVMPSVSYIVLNLVWARLSVFTSKIFSYLLKNAFER